MNTRKQIKEFKIFYLKRWFKRSNHIEIHLFLKIKLNQTLHLENKYSFDKRLQSPIPLRQSIISKIYIKEGNVNNGGLKVFVQNSSDFINNFIQANENNDKIKDYDNLVCNNPFTSRRRSKVKYS